MSKLTASQWVGLLNYAMGIAAMGFMAMKFETAPTNALIVVGTATIFLVVQGASLMRPKALEIAE